MKGIRGEQSIAGLCRKYGISDSTYYKWNKEFIEAGKARLEGDMLREA
jgi:ISCc3, transposase orfA